MGAINNDGNGSNSGHVRIFQFFDTDHKWNKVGADIDGEVYTDQSSYSISLSEDGSIVAIGGAITNDGKWS